MTHPGCRSCGSGKLSRRGFFQRVAGGIYGAALASLLERDFAGGRGLLAGEPTGSNPIRDLKPRPPHFAASATSVIHLFMNGGPSQMDLFDPKPVLTQRHGESYFEKIVGEVENVGSAGKLLRSPYRFAQHGKCGMWISEVLPNLTRHADDLALIRSLYTTNLTHEPALYLIQTGRVSPGRPSLGSWVAYGLGSENQNLPAYVILDDPQGLPVNGVENWQSGFLPPAFQGTRFRSSGSPVLNLRSEVDEPREVVELGRDLLSRLDHAHLRERPHQPNLEARISSYELAARMQLAASDALDMSGERPATLERYGIGKEPTDSYGRRCLLARRLVERGVRFVQLYLNAQVWDNHNSLASGLRDACARTDLPIAGLLADLKERGLFQTTLVIWGGEFGRLPISQLPPDRNESNAGRDHNKNAFCSWMAGAGIKGGTIHGATDELGFAAVDKRVSVPDWHATILHLLGLDHEALTYDQHGLREKLTSVEPSRVVKEILA